ncbi:MATE family efflux transporter [Cupriavidus pampae]|nr:hypothetical protein [Cupriavidus pampae]
MMGLIGIDALAAGGLALLLYNQFRTMCVGMVTGLGNLIAAAIGKGERRTGHVGIDAIAEEEIRDLIRSALFLATTVALVAGGLLVGLSFCLTSLGQDAAVVTLARPVMIGYGLIGLPAILLLGTWLGWRGEGVWLGLCIAFGATSALLWRSFALDLRRIAQRAL